MKKRIITNIGPAGQRRRVKERFRNAGRKALADYELIELLLTYAIPRVDTKPAAKALLKQFKTIFNVLQQPHERLLEIKGILADPGFRDSLLATMAKIQSGETKWSGYDEVFG